MSYLRLLSNLGREKWERAEDELVFSRRSFFFLAGAAIAGPQNFSCAETVPFRVVLIKATPEEVGAARAQQQEAWLQSLLDNIGPPVVHFLESGEILPRRHWEEFHDLTIPPEFRCFAPP